VSAAVDETGRDLDSTEAASASRETSGVPLCGVWLRAPAPCAVRRPLRRSTWLEVQTLEVIPEDLHLVGHPFPVGNVEGPNSSTATRVQLIGHRGVWRFMGRDEHLRSLDEGKVAQRRFFVQGAFFLAFPVEREIRVHLLLPGAQA